MVINIKSIKRTGGSFLVCVIELIKPCKNKPENETFKGFTVHNYIQNFKEGKDKNGLISNLPPQIALSS